MARHASITVGNYAYTAQDARGTLDELNDIWVHHTHVSSIPDGWLAGARGYLAEMSSLAGVSLPSLDSVDNAFTTLHGSDAAGLGTDSAEDFFFVKADKKLVKVFYKDILYVEGLKDYVIIRTETGRVITLQTMKSLEEKLPISMFQRVHRSFILNLTKIQALEGNMVEIIEKGQVKLIPIGKTWLCH